jgi:hypothetical protein
MPTFPLVGGQTETAANTPVTLALTITPDPNNLQPGDLHLLNGQLHFWDGNNARYQKTLTLLQFIKGEWFLNIEEGIPYFEKILIKNPNSRGVVSIFRKALLASPGAIQVPVITMAIDKTTRTARIDWELVFDDGAVLTSADFPPFIINVGSV